VIDELEPGRGQLDVSVFRDLHGHAGGVVEVSATRKLGENVTRCVFDLALQASLAETVMTVDEEGGGRGVDTFGRVFGRFRAFRRSCGAV
jgi:hypothetical protein